jgi:predicted enzyme related to lactoylglutathione lyase
MEFKVRSFATIRMSVSNIRKSRDWYRAFFGIDPVEDSENFVSFRVGNTLFDISLADEKSPLSTGGSVGYWLVDSLNEAIAKAERLGGQVYRGPLRVDEVKRTIVQIRDPNGNVFGLEAEY